MHHLAFALPMFFASIDYRHAITHVLDDLQRGVDVGSSGEGFQQVIVLLMPMFPFMLPPRS